MYSFFPHEFSTTVSSLLVVQNSTKHPVFTHLHINGNKNSSLMLPWCFRLSCSECRLRRFRLLFARKDLFEAGTSHAENKKRTTQLYCRWLSNSRTHSPCTQTSILDGNQLLFSNFPDERLGTFSWNINSGDTRVRTRDPSHCSRMLYHWAISPGIS